MAGNLSQLISSRGNYRGQVNRIYNDLTYLDSKSPKEKSILSSKLKRIQGELVRLDDTIRDLKWKENGQDEVKATRE